MDNENGKKENRIIKIFTGLRQPPSSRAYKEARIELERLSAPLAAILFPGLVAAVLFVVTAVGGAPKAVAIEIFHPDPDEPRRTEDPPEMPVENQQKDDPSAEISIDEPKIAIDFPTSPPSPEPPEPTEPLKGFEAMPVACPIALRVPPGFGGRDAGARKRALGSGPAGGGGETEQAVMKALRWLKKTQKSDGSWAGQSPTAMAGFAVLTYLAHNETPGSPEFGETVQRALDYLVGAVHEEGGVVKVRGSDGNEYAFLIAVYALCEAYGMTRNPDVREAAEPGLLRIVRGQSPTGGWDYKLNAASTRDDLSFGGWALQALKAGQMAGLEVAGLEAALKKAVAYLRGRAFKNGGFGYCAGHDPGGLTGTGCLALQLLGASATKEAKSALDYMRNWTPAWETHPGGRNPQYYSYYAAQCRYQAGMRAGATPADFAAWKKWNVAMKADYPKRMITPNETIPGPDGQPRAIGYWQNKDQHTDTVMGTCLCALQLMVYYRYLPTTSLKATEQAADLVAASTEKMDVRVTIDL